MAETAIVTVPMQQQMQRLEFNSEQRQMIRDSIANGMTDPEFAVFMEVARARNLNPITRQITPVSRYDKKKNRNVWSYQVTIDGFRCIAERTGRYEGQVPTLWCGPDGKWTDVWLKKEPPTAAKVGVLKRGFREPLYAVARWESYFPEGNFMWLKMPDLMIAKCAEALALRKAFPEDMSGLYTEDEMAQANPAGSIAERLPARRAARKDVTPPKRFLDTLPDPQAPVDAEVVDQPSQEELALKASVEANEARAKAQALANVQQAADELGGEIEGFEEPEEPEEEAEKGFVFPFGKHKGKAITEESVPMSYLTWLRDDIEEKLPDMREDWKPEKLKLLATVNAEIERRG